MTAIVTREQLENAALDAATLESFINAASGDITSRLGTVYPNLNKTLDNINASAQSAINGYSFKYNFDTVISPTVPTVPVAGDLRFSNASPASATAIYIAAATAAAGNPDISDVIATWDDSTNPTVKGTVIITKDSDPNTYAAFSLTGLTDNTTYLTLNLTFIQGNGTFANNDVLRVSFTRAGNVGDNGQNYGAEKYSFSTSTSMADPAAGNVRLNNATAGSVTAIAISAQSADTGNPNIKNFINTWDDSAHAPKGMIKIAKIGAPQNYIRFGVTGLVTDNTTWCQIGVSYIDGSGTINNTDNVAITFQAYGTDGSVSSVSRTNGGGITLTISNPTTTPNIAVSVANLRTIFIPAGAMKESASGGCAGLANIASGSNQPDIRSLDFDGTTKEYAQFAVRMPKAWDKGTITAAFIWSHAATVTNFGVRWGLQGVAVSDDDTIAVAYGTAQEVTDTGGTTNDLYVSPNTAAITIAGSPADGDVLFFRVYRDPVNAADTMAIDARLQGITLFYNVNTLDDA